MSTTTAGRAAVQALLAVGVDHAFCVPGESFLGLLDALYDEPRVRPRAEDEEPAEPRIDLMAVPAEDLEQSALF